jgi:hypothetical protein
MKKTILTLLNILTLVGISSLGFSSMAEAQVDPVTGRIAYASNPVAYRGEDGRLNLYYTQNIDNGLLLIGVNSPYKMHHTYMVRV